MRFLLVLAGILLLAGCVTTEVQENQTPSPPVEQPPPPPPPPPENQTMTCEEYCPTQPHVQCVGQWDISGTYPDCVCEFVCDVQPVEEDETEDDGLDVDDLAQPSDKTIMTMLNEALDKSRSDFYSENDGSYEETKYTWKRAQNDSQPGEITFDLAPITDVRFDGDPIPSIQAAGFIVFDDGDMQKSYGAAIFLAKTTALDSYTGTDAFDIEYFYSVDHRYMDDCWVKSKDFSKNMAGEWVTTYFLRCEKVFPLSE